MLSLPPHTAQRLQPLNVSFFKPFKTAYDKAWMRNHVGRRIMTENIAGLCKVAFESASTHRNIINGFTSAGIWPFNPDTIQDNEYSDIAEIENNRQLTCNNLGNAQLSSSINGSNRGC